MKLAISTRPLWRRSAWLTLPSIWLVFAATAEGGVQADVGIGAPADLSPGAVGAVDQAAPDDSGLREETGVDVRVEVAGPVAVAAQAPQIPNPATAAGSAAPAPAVSSEAPTPPAPATPDTPRAGAPGHPPDRAQSVGRGPASGDAGRAGERLGAGIAQRTGHPHDLATQVTRATSNALLGAGATVMTAIDSVSRGLGAAMRFVDQLRRDSHGDQPPRIGIELDARTIADTEAAVAVGHRPSRDAVSPGGAFPIEPQHPIAGAGSSHPSSASGPASDRSPIGSVRSRGEDRVSPSMTSGPFGTLGSAAPIVVAIGLGALSSFAAPRIADRLLVLRADRLTPQLLASLPERPG